MPSSSLTTLPLSISGSIPLSLYIHWPFCISKCPYCDFNSHVSEAVDEGAWLNALCAELDHMAAIAKETLGSETICLETMFFGGGTPSLMPPKIVSTLIDRAGALFSLSETVEITAEANPNSAEMAQMTSFRHAGINRLSLGIQSLEPEGLALLGRAHSEDEACHALELACGLFNRVSADLIYGLANQSAVNWESQLNRIFDFGITHLSAYQLTIEPGTIFHSRTRSGAVLTADPDHVADLYELTEDLTATAGLPAYEVSNYASPTAQSRHNLTYWKSGNWIAVGPGAHCRLTYSDTQERRHLRLRRSPQGWLSDVMRFGHAIEEDKVETHEDKISEYWMMGLRLVEGRPVIPHFARMKDTTAILDEDWKAAFCQQGWLSESNGYLKTSLEGRLRLDYILGKLLG